MTEPAAESLQIVSEIMRRYGARCTPAEFHASVNVTFHNFESQVYDQAHANMWDSLPRQFALLIDDCLERYPHFPEKLRVLDIGAGTGLASHCLIGTAVGARISSVDLLDTSPAMLKQALQRSAKWNIPVRSHLGLIDGLPQENTYEIVLACSVLHHVPDLQAFCLQVRQHQASGGIFLHLQDPNPGALERERSAQKSTNLFRTRVLGGLARFAPRRILGRIHRELTGKQGDNYVSKTNRVLIQEGIITRPLKVADLYAITDIHVMDGQGVSIEKLRRWLPDYECLSHRSYAFFGKLWSDLPSGLQAREEELSLNNDLNGFHVAAAWRRRA
jgi:SAM-dependent methyltransferase